MKRREILATFLALIGIRATRVWSGAYNGWHEVDYGKGVFVIDFPSNTGTSQIISSGYKWISAYYGNHHNQPPSRP